MNVFALIAITTFLSLSSAFGRSHQKSDKDCVKTVLDSKTQRTIAIAQAAMTDPFEDLNRYLQLIEHEGACVELHIKATQPYLWGGASPSLIEAGEKKAGLIQGNSLYDIEKEDALNGKIVSTVKTDFVLKGLPTDSKVLDGFMESFHLKNLESSNINGEFNAKFITTYNRPIQEIQVTDTQGKMIALKKVAGATFVFGNPILTKIDGRNQTDCEELVLSNIEAFKPVKNTCYWIDGSKPVGKNKLPLCF